MKKICTLILLLTCLAGCSPKAVDLDPQTAATTLSDACTGDSPLSKLDLDAALTLYATQKQRKGPLTVFSNSPRGMGSYP